MINKCKQCEYTYDSAKIDRAENMRNHKENRQKCDFKCSLCNFSSSHKRSLEVHHIIHTGETPYTCEQCSYASNQRGNLRSHMKTHGNENSFKCSSHESSKVEIHAVF